MWGLGDSGRPPPFRLPGEPRSGLDESDREPGLPILLFPVLLSRCVRSVSAKAFLLFSIRSGCYIRTACCQCEYAFTTCKPSHPAAPLCLGTSSIWQAPRSGLLRWMRRFVTSC